MNYGRWSANSPNLLSEDDVAAVAEALEPGSTAGLLIYENLWAAPFASAVRRAGGQLVAGGRIPAQQLLAVLEDELAERGRLSRIGGIVPSRETTASVGDVVIVRHGYARRR